MAWVEILPGFETMFRQLGWDTAAPFLAWKGILVNHHRHRQVEQVLLPSSLAAVGRERSDRRSFFLKKESAVTWRDRLRNAWHGFGWCSTAAREGAMLQALRAAGIGCPEVAALGEDGRYAFVLTRDQSSLSELRSLVGLLVSELSRRQFAVALGRELARMHDAGFDHPDLFAKHILATQEKGVFRFCILDWQRGRRRRSVSWRIRCRDLATLDATMHSALAGDRFRLQCLRAYLASVAKPGPPLGRLAVAIRQQAKRLLRKHNMREIGGLPVPAGDQQFVPLHEGRLLVVRSFFEDLDGKLPPWLVCYAEPESQTWDAPVPTRASPADNVWVHSLARTGGGMPPLAHTLFRLQRFGVPAPRLLAVASSALRDVAITRSTATVPLGEALAKASFEQRCRMLRQVGTIVRNVHEAGYCLPASESWTRLLGAVSTTGDVFLAKVESLVRCRRNWQELAPIEFNRHRFRLSRTEQLRFLRGYLKRSCINDHDRAWLRTLHMPGDRVLER